MPTTEPTPPVRELPADYAQDVDRLTSKYRLPDDLEPEMRAIERELSDLMGGGITVCDVLRTAIRAALTQAQSDAFTKGEKAIIALLDREKGLRERAERLRQAVVALGDGQYPRGLGAWPIEPGDLADDLRLREGDVRYNEQDK